MSSNDPRAPSFRRTVPQGDSLPRLVCERCDFVHYDNPKIVVGSVVTHEGQYLMCRRAIEPRRGHWTLPAGFLELGESPLEGAMREAEEEACAKLAIDGLLAVYSLKHLSQVQLMYRATLATPDFAPGPESLEVRLFDYEALPWDDLAFPSVRWALEQHRALGAAPVGAPFVNPPGEDGAI